MAKGEEVFCFFCTHTSWKPFLLRGYMHKIELAMKDRSHVRKDKLIGRRVEEG